MQLTDCLDAGIAAFAGVAWVTIVLFETGADADAGLYTSLEG